MCKQQQKSENWKNFVTNCWFQKSQEINFFKNFVTIFYVLTGSLNENSYGYVLEPQILLQYSYFLYWTSLFLSSILCLMSSSICLYVYHVITHLPENKGYFTLLKDINSLKIALFRFRGRKLKDWLKKLSVLEM